MKDVERLYKNLQKSNEESKTVHNAKTMKELRSGMDVDVAQVLKRVKVIKGKLEALERSNAAHRSNPGGESETFLQKAIQEQGRGQILDTISEIQEGHDAVKEIEKNLIELHQVFLDMVALVEAQGQQLNDIKSHVAHANSFVKRGTEQLQEAREYQKSSRKFTCIAIGLGACVLILMLFPFGSCIVETLDIFPVMDNIFSAGSRKTKKQKDKNFPQSFEHVSCLPLVAESGN
ncbi:hypothetical protein TEA_022716 [Camellia sinensis var. sinensis]|uniref:t-SNARE coiled-coil homology domain-containing protein n=1 Tax=Camellia sinensis var. sinensis TaxID=542762 RepID=A0A4S4EP56_CAMSN|nr:hypothetical protein TEA_022716 [Camellia sinensis var. sinensis]